MPNIPKAQREANRDLAKRVAFLMGRPERFSPKDIRKTLETTMPHGIKQGITGPQLSKLIAIAEKERWVTRECWLPTEEQEQYESELLHGKLFEKLKAIGGISNLHVFTTPDYSPRHEGKANKEQLNWEDRVIEFSNRSHAACLKHLSKSRLAGVTFGRQLASITRSMPTLLAGHQLATEFIPCWGDSVLPAEQPGGPWTADEISSSGLAANLTQKLSEDETCRTLRSVPVYRPSNFEGDFEQVLQFHANLTDYEEVFGPSAISRFSNDPKRRTVEPSHGLIWNIDCLLAAFGGPNGLLFSEDFLRLGNINRQKLRGQTCGDFGGVWLPHPHKKKLDEVHAAAKNWTCITEEMILACSKRGRETDAVGVIGIAVGGELAIAVREALKKQLVNVLIIDDQCKEALEAVI